VWCDIWFRVFLVHFWGKGKHISVLLKLISQVQSVVASMLLILDLNTLEQREIY